MLAQGDILEIGLEYISSAAGSRKYISEGGELGAVATPGSVYQRAIPYYGPTSPDVAQATFGTGLCIWPRLQAQFLFSGLNQAFVLCLQRA
jgi:hypothetical protein